MTASPGSGGGALHFGERPRRRAEAPVASLVDIVFLLLVFFMLAGTFFEIETIGIGVPEQAAAAAPSDRPLVVRLHGDGTVSVNGVVVGIEGVRPFVAGQVGLGFEGAVVLAAPPGAPIRRVVAAVDEIRAGGVDEISVAVGEGP